MIPQENLVILFHHYFGHGKFLQNYLLSKTSYAVLLVSYIKLKNLRSILFLVITLAVSSDFQKMKMIDFFAILPGHS